MLRQLQRKNIDGAVLLRRPFYILIITFIAASREAT